ncbi:MAG TPA: zinc finger domain-containing protein, partial [Planctomycetaceae bacterium]|nr:zinc finger domain-containing protein [Planctomycetaceae bacterium]
DSPPDVAHLRYEWRFTGRREFNSLWFWDQRGLGTIRLYTPAEFEEQLGRGRLGPDALTMTLDDWRTGCSDANRPIKVLLLDQRVAAGIGNLYASEILHRSAIHPEHRANRLTLRQLARMAVVVREVLEEAIRYEGSTLGDGTYRNALNKAGGYQNAHRVYAREDESCTTCGKGRIVRIVQAQRSTFFCPRCQRLPRARAAGK